VLGTHDDLPIFSAARWLRAMTVNDGLIPGADGKTLESAAKTLRNPWTRNSGSTTVTVTQPGGTAPVVLSVTGLPANVTATFSPTSVANGTSTLTVTAKGNAARGTFNVVVSGTNPAATHTANLSLTIQ